ncbi:MAG TPA: hypothetical protein VLL94_10490, partial [Nitrospiraceae bacterium]|nr:hypothetical protein [Nitrospiraceae bacterium]
MTPEEQIMKMKKAIAQAIKVMGDRFGSTETDVAKAIDELKASMQTTPVAVPPARPARAAHADARAASRGL